MKEFLKKLKAGTEELNYGRDVIARIVRKHFPETDGEALRLLDLGLGLGGDVAGIREALAPREVKANGLENYEPYVREAEKKGIKVVQVDIEREVFPFEDSSFDLVLANQVLEHTKEIFWIASESARVLRPGGLLVVGVPNLASLHSRVMLLLGMQPSPIEVFGPHVRGFTKGGFRDFIEAGGYFKVNDVRGSNFYPFPAWVARPAARLFPSFAVGIFFACERTQKDGRLVDILAERFFETPFFRGD